MERENANMKDFERYLDFTELGPGQVVEATVTGVDPAEGLSVDFGGKQEGRIQPSELVRNLRATEWVKRSRHKYSR